ncbi:MAG: 50S ribosomal protein L32e [Candidatus Bathyarchaeia archaeon]|jgi:large subunit ribosomal protein L32e
MSEKKISPSRKELRIRERARNKKPKFVRAESWRFDRFSESWRRPRGLDNKIRRKILGWPPGPSMGYKGPKVARGLHPSGYREVIVYNVADLSNVDINTQAVRIGHTVGKRKRADIIAKAKELNLKILNIKVSAEAEAEETEEEEAEESEETTEEEVTEEKKEAKAEKKKPKPKAKKEEAKPKEKPKEKAKAKPKKKETKPKTKPKKGGKKQ